MAKHRRTTIFRLGAAAVVSLAAAVTPSLAHAAAQPPSTDIFYNSGQGGDLTDGTQFSQAVIGNVVPLAAEVMTYDRNYATTVQLTLDGNVVASASCPAPPPAATGSDCGADYDFTPGAAAPGTHVFQVKATLSGGQAVSGPMIHVVVVADPDPLTAQLDSPAEGATVSGTVAVTATGTVTAASGDAGQSMQLFTNAGPLGAAVPCPAEGAPLKCTVTLQWDTSILPNGPYTLYAEFRTRDDHGTFTQAVNVTLANATTAKAIVTLAPGGTYPVGGYGQVHGTVVNAATGKPFAGALVTVSYTPYSGQAFSETEFTDLDGNFAALDPINLTSNTVVTATTGPDGLNAPATTSWQVTVPISCKVPSAVTHGTPVSITCHADHLAYHSVLALRISGGSIPHATQYGKIDSHGNVTFTQTFVHAHQQLSVRATSATTRTFSASSSPSYPLTVS